MDLTSPSAAGSHLRWPSLQPAVWVGGQEISRYLGVLTVPCTAELWPHLAATLAPPGEDKLLARLEVRGAALAATDVPHLARCVRAGDGSENIFM